MASREQVEVNRANAQKCPEARALVNLLAHPESLGLSARRNLPKGVARMSSPPPCASEIPSPNAAKEPLNHELVSFLTFSDRPPITTADLPDATAAPAVTPCCVSSAITNADQFDPCSLVQSNCN